LGREEKICNQTPVAKAALLDTLLGVTVFWPL
jgi:hypothetical protein